MTSKPLPPLPLYGPTCRQSEAKARDRLARQLANGDLVKFALLRELPLFEVALSGAVAL
jgi:hypothetical protein